MADSPISLFAVKPQASAPMQQRKARGIDVAKMQLLSDPNSFDGNLDRALQMHLMNNGDRLDASSEIRFPATPNGESNAYSFGFSEYYQGSDQPTFLDDLRMKANALADKAASGQITPEEQQRLELLTEFFARRQGS